jgi:hypothetical protein
MRSPAAVWAVLFLMLAFPFSAAAPNPVPAITIHMEPTTTTVNSTSALASAIFNGSVQVDKLQLQTVTVDLASSVENGLAATVEPASMTFTSAEPQNFTCTVTVPKGTPQQSTEVSMIGTGKTMLFTVTESCQCILVILGPAPPRSSGNSTNNSTGGQGGTGNGNQTSANSGNGGPAGFGGLKYEQLGILAAASILIVVVAGIVSYRQRAKKRRAIDWMGKG